MMLKITVFYVAAMAVIPSAHAGDRDVPGLRPGNAALAADATLTAADRPQFGQQRFTLADPRAQLQAAAPVRFLTTGQPRAAEEPMRLVVGIEDTTSSAGGSYAVTDTMGAMRRPHHRKSALSTALVFKIDGEDDTPSVGLGGGGVAAAVWKAIPR